MDTRRLLTLAVAAATLPGCAILRPDRPVILTSPPPVALAALERSALMAIAPVGQPLSPPEMLEAAADAVPVVPDPVRRSEPSGLSGRQAIAAANVAARAASVSDGFVGGEQVFAWSPGRVFEVWTAPLRVTTLTLGAGEVLVAKAAGDTVRWQIGEAQSGDGANLRTHVLLKPLERGLETNLVLTTNRRIYLIDLKSGAADAFNAAVTWDDPVAAVALGLDRGAAMPTRVADSVVLPEGEIDAGYRIVPHGRRPRWTPTAVFNDGIRTFITFDPDLQVDEAPVLFVIAADGEHQMTNYRQAGGLFVVDRLFDRAELRLGGRRPQVVRLQRLGGGRP